ncbi:MAG: T9SS type A sorting domain-containing protein, partial [Bacteroidota bacterium]
LWISIPTTIQAQMRSENNAQIQWGNIDFEVKPSGNRRFTIYFNNSNNTLVQVRIYDVIGNMVKEEVVSAKGKFSKEYDMSQNKSEVFIVEVGNTKYSTTKRVFLQ